MRRAPWWRPLSSSNGARPASAGNPHSPLRCRSTQVVKHNFVGRNPFQNPLGKR
jgi:hypothetical protein